MKPKIPENPIEEAALKLAAGICPGCIHFDPNRSALCNNGALAERPCHKFNLEDFYYDERRHRFWCRHRSELDVVSAKLAAAICPECAYFDKDCAVAWKNGEITTKPCPQCKKEDFYYDKALKKFWCKNWKRAAAHKSEKGKNNV